MSTSRRVTTPVIAALIACSLIVPTAHVLAAAPAQARPVSPAKAVVMPGWSPLDPPSDPALFEQGFPYILYTVTCGSVTATGWSADFGDDTVGDWDTALVTTSQVAAACLDRPGGLIVRQGDDTFVAEARVSDPSSGLGIVVLEGDMTRIDWDFVPSPRVGQWVAIDARAADGTVLPMIQSRVKAVGEDTFTLDAAVGPEYVGAPVVDNQARALGVISAAGALVTGMPQMCDSVTCSDASKVWWDITAPSRPRAVTGTAGKGRITVTWKPASNDGGAEVAYWYRVNGGPWIYSDTFSMTRKARSGTSVAVIVGSVNQAGSGPLVAVTVKAK